MNYEGFIGPTNTLYSRHANMERTINWMLETSRPGTPQVDPYLRDSPGLRRYWLLNEAPIRGMYALNGRMYAVGGTEFVETFDDQTFIVRGTVSNAGVSGGVGDSVSFASNGTAGDQIAMSAGGQGYIFNTTTNTLTQITDPDFLTPVYMVVFIDGYFVWLLALTRKFFWSALEDGLTYDALDVAEVSRTADNLVCMAQSHGQLWLLGQQTADVWADIGNGAIFAPATGGFIEQGSAAPFSVANLDNTIFWVGANTNGARFVFRAKGYTPERVSDHGVEFRLSQADRIDNAIGFSCMLQGHPLYLLYVPDLNTTQVYDVSTGVWHEWAWWKGPGRDDSDFRAFVGRNHAFAFEKHFVGDRQSRAIYNMSFEFKTDVITECSN